MTCFNRKSLTIASLDRLFSQDVSKHLTLEVFLVDDGSSDGTSEAVHQRFPAVNILQGDGSLFWNGGMRRAFQVALQHGFDAYVWFNDDSMLYKDAISRLVLAAKACELTVGPSIVVGSFRDAVTGVHTYGGIRKIAHGLNLDFVPVCPAANEMLPCDTMNGNLTLISAPVAELLENLDAAFAHQLGDFDYGLRATAAGVPVRVAAGYFGTCSDNSSLGTWRDRTQPFSTRWKNLMSPKGAPIREWLLYTRRHFGWRWPFYAVSPYLKTILLR